MTLCDTASWGATMARLSPIAEGEPEKDIRMCFLLEAEFMRGELDLRLPPDPRMADSLVRLWSSSHGLM
jgi:hypothetical protein